MKTCKKIAATLIAIAMCCTTSILGFAEVYIGEPTRTSIHVNAEDYPDTLSASEIIDLIENFPKPGEERGVSQYTLCNHQNWSSTSNEIFMYYKASDETHKIRRDYHTCDDCGYRYSVDVDCGWRPGNTSW